MPRLLASVLLVLIAAPVVAQIGPPISKHPTISPQASERQETAPASPKIGPPPSKHPPVAPSRSKDTIVAAVPAAAPGPTGIASALPQIGPPTSKHPIVFASPSWTPNFPLAFAQIGPPISKHPTISPQASERQETAPASPEIGPPPSKHPPVAPSRSKATIVAAVPAAAPSPTSIASALPQIGPPPSKHPVVLASPSWTPNFSLAFAQIGPPMSKHPTVPSLLPTAAKAPAVLSIAQIGPPTSKHPVVLASGFENQTFLPSLAQIGPPSSKHPLVPLAPFKTASFAPGFTPVGPPMSKHTLIPPAQPSAASVVPVPAPPPPSIAIVPLVLAPPAGGALVPAVPPPPPGTDIPNVLAEPPSAATATRVAALEEREGPLPLFAVDLRGVFVPLKVDAKTSDTLAIPSYVLPGRGLGLAGGVHIYPFRRGSFGFGLGAEFLVASGSDQDSDPVTGEPVGPDVNRRLRSLTGQVSLNFGGRRGWSYINAGFGPIRYDTYTDEAIPDGPPTMATNFGFGARWFNNKHAAFNLDLRFYLSPPNAQVITSAGRDRQTLMVVSIGISLK